MKKFGAKTDICYSHVNCDTDTFFDDLRVLTKCRVAPYYKGVSGFGGMEWSGVDWTGLVWRFLAHAH